MTTRYPTNYGTAPSFILPTADHPRLLRALRGQGMRVAKKRIDRVMRADGLRARQPRAFGCTTDSAHADPIAPDQLDRRFALADHPTPNRPWVGDMT